MVRLPKGVTPLKYRSALLALILSLCVLPGYADNTQIKTLAPLSPDKSSIAAATAAPSQLSYTPPEQAEPEGQKLAAVLPGAKNIVAATINPANVLAPANTPASAAAQASPPAVTSEPANTSNSLAAPTSVNALAQASQTVPEKAQDPAVNVLPLNAGTLKIRKQFKLFAKEELIHNLSFRDTPVREVIAEIARRGNLNVIIDKSVVGRITGDLHDVTLNEAMDSALAASGLQSRVLDNNTVIIASPNALLQLGLNRPMARAFKLSYASAYEVASILFASVFNKGIIPDFNASFKRRFIDADKDQLKVVDKGTADSSSVASSEGGGRKQSKSNVITTHTTEDIDNNEGQQEFSQVSRPDNQRSLKGINRTQVTEGTGYAAASTDPGSQQIRAYQEVTSDFTVEQNGGGAIVIPDVKNRQVIVVGTSDDLVVAEECIRLIDRRPAQVHIQASLIELTNAGIRQLGAALNLQGEGASGTILGGSGAPLVQFLPGLGSQGIVRGSRGTTFTSTGTLTETGIPPVPTTFVRTSIGSLANPFTQPALTDTQPTAPPSGVFRGFLGSVLPLTAPSIAGVNAAPTAQSGFNFLTLGTKAGGRYNIATLPTALNASLNLVLQTNKGKLLANPSVIVSDNTESLITLANEVVHKITTTVSLGVVSTNVELTKAGIFLNVLPKVTQDGFITMRLRPSVSTPLGAPISFANGNVVVTLLNIREIMSQEVRVKDGQTLVIGGLFSEQENAQLSKVPYLAEAPILGALFRNSLKGRNRVELLLLITPRVVEEQPATAITEGSFPAQM